MNRRALLKSASAALLAFGFDGCATSRIARKISTFPADARSPLKLSLVEASWDRVIRTTVGLRPHRDSGFVLRAEKLDEKLLVHNYGHGGSGMSLSWGTGYMASETAAQHDQRLAAVIGCGVTGLTTARQLQRRGFDVTIYAMSVPPDTTSNMSLAGFTPTSGLIENTRRTPEWTEQFRRAAQIAYRQLQLLAGPSYGVSWIYSYTLTDEPEEGPPETGDLLPAELRTGGVRFEPGEHPFPTKYAFRRPVIRIEPSIYLDALVRDFLSFGGRIIIRKFDTPRDFMSLPQPIVINCTGLGSRMLLGDEELVPLKGQLTHFVPQPEINYQTTNDARNPALRGNIGIHMMPRTDGLALGGTSERGVWTLEPNEEARQEVVNQHIQLFAAMRRDGFRGRTPNS
jgi:D-amino-acid oxidase